MYEVLLEIAVDGTTRAARDRIAARIEVELPEGWGPLAVHAEDEPHGLRRFGGSLDGSWDECVSELLRISGSVAKRWTFDARRFASDHVVLDANAEFRHSGMTVASFQMGRTTRKVSGDV